MKGKLKWDTIPENNFVLPPEGEYDGVIVSHKDKITEAGDDMVSIKISFNDKYYVWDNIVLSNNPESSGYKIRGKSSHFLHCIGESYEGDFDWDSDNWDGKKVKFKLKHKKYDDVAQLKVSHYILQEQTETAPF